MSRASCSRARRLPAWSMLWHGKVQFARAGREVILSAGALQSPQLLQLSGVGDAAHLKRLGIDAGHRLAGCRREPAGSLSGPRAILHLKQKRSLNNDVRNPLPADHDGTGLVVAWPRPAHRRRRAGGWRSDDAVCARPGRPDIQFNVMPLSVDKPGEPLHRYAGFTSSFWQCHPASRGHVRIRSTDPLAQPEIAPNYLSEEIDRQTMVEGVRMLRAIHGQPAFRDLWDREVWPGRGAQSDEEILDFVRANGGTVFHPVGTCRMGSRRPGGRRSRPSCPGRRGPACRRRLGDADDHVGEYERGQPDDWRARGGANTRGPGLRRCRPFRSVSSTDPFLALPGPRIVG